MKKFKVLPIVALLLSSPVFVANAQAQSAIIRGEQSAGVYVNIPVDTNKYLYVNCPGCTGAAAPVGANNADGVASVGTGLNSGVNYLYGYNGTTWDRLLVDGSKSLKVNCITGCSAGSGTGANNADAVASVGTGLGSAVSYNMGYNGTTWDRLQLDGSKFLKVINQSGSTTVVTGTVAVTRSGTWDITNAGTFATQATQAGTWNITNISGTISLPTLASTSTKQSDGSQKTQIVDGSGNVIASTSNNLNVQCANCSGSGVSTADEATFTAGTSLFAGSGGFFQTTATSNALTNGQQGMLQLTAQRAAFVNLRNSSGVEIDTNSGNKSAATIRVVLATDQPVLTNKLLVTPDSVALPANQSVNVSQISGTTADTNSGTKSAGTIRVVLATDQPALTNKLLVTPDSVALPANQSVNVSQVGGTAVVADPCQAIAKTSLAISQATSTQIISGTSAKKTYICSLVVIAGAAENISLTAGTGSVCATGASAIIGSTTVANGMILAANAGFAIGSGVATIASGTVNADNICILQSGSVRVSGVLTYVQQ